MPGELLLSSELPELVKVVNRKGLLLEDKAVKVLEGVHGTVSLNRGQVYSDEDGSRVEVDIISHVSNMLGHYTFIIECKRTAYTWLFPIVAERPAHLYIAHIKKDWAPLVHTTGSSIRGTYSDVVIEINEQKRLSKSRGQVNVSYKEVNENVRQVLKELRCVLIDVLKKKFVQGIFVPIIVTNAKLGVIDYSKAGLNSVGELTEIAPITEVPYIAYDFPEIMDVGGKPLALPQQARVGAHLKTVFVVNIEHLAEFIDKIQDELDGKIPNLKLGYTWP
ncbi:MAG: hypothetical protein WCW44_04080 [archaeon]|jgi:hypothetical protein